MSGDILLKFSLLIYKDSNLDPSGADQEKDWLFILHYPDTNIVISCIILKFIVSQAIFIFSFEEFVFLTVAEQMDTKLIGFTILLP